MNDYALAEDLVQDVFLTFWLKRDTLDPDVKLTGWLFKTLGNKIMNEANKAYRTRELPFPPGFEPASKTAEDFMASLPSELREEERRLLYLYFAAGLSHGEIAARLNCTADACKMRLFRAKMHYRDILLSYKKF